MGVTRAPTLATERLCLRPWRDSDQHDWIAMCEDPRVMEFLGPPRGREADVATAIALAARLEQNGYGWWIAERTTDGAFLGCIALQDVPFEAHFTPAIEVGWRLAFEHWGHGYATEGARAALDYAFGPLGRSEVVAITARTNLRSQRVMQRLGMTTTPADDFDHPRLPEGSPIRPHVLYRTRQRAM